MTSLLVASKYDELDEYIPLIRDLQRYFQKYIPISERIPSFDEIIECERVVMNYFNWDLMFLIPIHFVKMLHANGVIFDNEKGANVDLCKKVTDKSN